MSELYQVVGTPRFGGILVVGDHAGKTVPSAVDLGIDSALLDEHIGHDIGVAGVAERMANRDGIAAFLSDISRLVVDLNRRETDPAAIPETSDGSAVPGNVGIDRAARLAAYHRPFHEALGAQLDATPPALTVFLHSFTPAMNTDDEPRPWECGVLYDQDPRGAMAAKALLEAEGLCVGDQQPYSGAVYNATIRCHAEEPGRPYLYLELRQDLIADAAGQIEWSERLSRICNRIAMDIA